MTPDIATAQLAKARALLDKHGLKDWRVAFANLSRVPTKVLTGTSSGAVGTCSFWDREILIDWCLVNRPTLFRQTVLHEIAHAVFGRRGHGPEWLRVARKIGCTKRSLEIYKHKILQ